MGIRKVYERLAVTARQYFGSGENVSQRYDSGAGQYVQRDETNGVDQVVIQDGNDLTDELEENGAMELVISNLLNFDAEAIIIGSRANRPAAGTANRLYIETNADGRILRDDGGSWNEVSVSAAAIKDGNVSSVDAAELDASSGNDGQVLQSDGNSASWASAQGIGADNVEDIVMVMSGGSSAGTH
jgi:hypothetical protein